MELSTHIKHGWTHAWHTSTKSARALAAAPGRWLASVRQNAVFGASAQPLAAPSTTAPSYKRLPVELLLQIAGCIDDERDLARLAQVDRTTRSVLLHDDHFAYVWRQGAIPKSPEAQHALNKLTPSSHEPLLQRFCRARQRQWALDGWLEKEPRKVRFGGRIERMLFANDGDELLLWITKAGRTHALVQVRLPLQNEPSWVACGNASPDKARRSLPYFEQLRLDLHAPQIGLLDCDLFLRPDTRMALVRSHSARAPHRPEALRRQASIAESGFWLPMPRLSDQAAPLRPLLASDVATTHALFAAVWSFDGQFGVALLRDLRWSQVVAVPLPAACGQSQAYLPLQREALSRAVYLGGSGFRQVRQHHLALSDDGRLLAVAGQGMRNALFVDKKEPERLSAWRGRSARVVDFADARTRAPASPASLKVFSLAAHHQ